MQSAVAPIDPRPVLCLSGGVGGAKLALGLLVALPANALTVLANTGDDFEHLGLTICPDIDTLLYALSDRDDQAKGWGRRNESWHFMEALAELGGDTWFQLGDRDLAMHVERTRRLRAGASLSKVTADTARRFGIAASLLPMSDDAVRTRLETPEGWMDFQAWFVGRRAEPQVSQVVFDGAEAASLHPAIPPLLANPALRAVIICPSNPYLSIDPILALPGLRDALKATRAPVVAVSPLIGGKAVKGPTAKLMQEFNLPTDVETIAGHYAGLIDGIVIDKQDAAAAARLAPLAVSSLPILMTSRQDRTRVAQAALDLADTLARRAA